MVWFAGEKQENLKFSRATKEWEQLIKTFTIGCVKAQTEAGCECVGYLRIFTESYKLFN